MERQHVGDRIKDLRIHHGMTLKELGDVIDFNYSNLSKIERGIRKPTIEILETLSNYFNIEISYFFGRNKNTLKEYGDWVKLSEEMKHKNITLEEVRQFIETLDKSKNELF